MAKLHQESVKEAQKSLGYRASTAVQEALRFQKYVQCEGGDGDGKI